MEDFINTVRKRYMRQTGYRGLTTLLYRGKTIQIQNVDTEEGRTNGFVGMLRTQIKGVSQKLRDEVNRLLERRDKLLLQSVTRDMPKIIGQNTEKLRSESQKTGKEQSEKTIRLQKRVELLSADTGAKLKAVQRELERLRAAETGRSREEAKRAREEPLTARNTELRAKREAERKREEFKREVDAELTKTERRITRKLRDEEEYQKRRRG